MQITNNCIFLRIISNRFRCLIKHLLYWFNAIYIIIKTPPFLYKKFNGGQIFAYLTFSFYRYWFPYYFQLYHCCFNCNCYHNFVDLIKLKFCLPLLVCHLFVFALIWFTNWEKASLSFTAISANTFLFRFIPDCFNPFINLL